MKVAMTASLSILIPTYNNTAYLALVLEGLARQRDRDFEVVVADDGSRADTADLVRSYESRLRVRHAWQADIGFRLAANRNNALAQASGDLVVFLDGDCIPHPEYVADARRMMHAREGVYVQGHRVFLDAAVSREIVEGGVSRLPEIWTARWVLSHARHLGNIQNAFRYPWPVRAHNRLKGVRGCSMLFWASDLHRVNGCDEAFVGWGHEDRDLVRRLFEAGIRRVDARGCFSVYHLWHRENDRTDEGGNLSLATVARPWRCVDGLAGGWRGSGR